VLLKITVEQNGVILDQSIVEIDDDESLSVAIKSAVDTVRAQDRSKPLWGLGIKVDKLTYGRRQPASTSSDRNRAQEHGAEPKPAS
jgi:hypothetical protein